MLVIQQKRTGDKKKLLLGVTATILLLGGLYAGALLAAPAAAPIFTMKPIDVSTLPAPAKSNNRIVIPKLGIDIAYETGASALERGAEWRSPESGNPLDGGNFVIAAHRFSIQPTPQGTIEKSPFYNINKLANSDKIIIDYEGKRYGYEIFKGFSVKPTQIEIEARTTDPILTLYSCSLGGAESDRFVIQAKRMGEVALAAN